jgi:hypothetical protein
MLDDASVLWESPLFGTELFVIHPLTSVVTISREKLKSQLTLGGVLHAFAHISALLPETERHTSPQNAVSGR